MGAELIKVQTPGTGDLARQLGGDAHRNGDLTGGFVSGAKPWQMVEYAKPETLVWAVHSARTGGLSGSGG